MASSTDLVDLLDLTRLDAHRFRARALDTEQTRTYGGQLVAQALMAAGRTVDDDRPVHSLHAYFLRGGAPSNAIDFSVEPVRESGSFSTCRVVVEQEGRVLLTLDASFHVPELGPEVDDPMPDVAPPEAMVAIDDWTLAQAMPDQSRDVPHFVDVFEYRQAAATLPGTHGPDEHAPRRDLWVRVPSALPDWPLLHACVLAYASDKPLLGTTVLAPPVSADPRAFLIASLDHSMWFHRPCRADAWTLFRLHSSATGEGRAFVRAECFREDGALAFSAAQQGLVRLLR